MSLLTSLAVYCLVWVASGCASPSAPASPLGTTQDDDQIAGTKGLPVSANVPSFMPKHLTGPHEGKTACPVCVYGLVPQLQIWVQEENLQDGLKIARLAEQHCEANKHARKEHRPVAYLVVAARDRGTLSPESLAAVRALGTQQVFATEVPSWEDVPTSGLYGHANSDKPKVRIYSVVNRRLLKRWDNPSDTDWPAIKASMTGATRYVTDHAVADATIAPAWEPGQRLEVRFRVVDGKNQPLSGVKVSAMQTDTAGHYNPGGWNRRDPRLKTLAWTDRDGWITFRTIMPGPYPREPEPAHIHFSALIDGVSKFRTLWFEGDPLLNTERRAWASKDEETTIIPLARSGQLWRAEHTFRIQ